MLGPAQSRTSCRRPGAPGVELRLASAAIVGTTHRSDCSDIRSAGPGDIPPRAVAASHAGCFVAGAGFLRSRRGACRRTAIHRRSRKEQLIQSAVVTIFCQRPAQTGCYSSFQVTMDAGLADGTTTGDLVLEQAEIVPQT